MTDDVDPSDMVDIDGQVWAEERAPTINSERDRVHRMVTLVMNGERQQAAMEAESSWLPTVTALVAVDCVAYVHRTWANALGMGPDEAAESWQHIMTDLADWVNAHE